MLVSLSSQRVKVTVRREECNKSSKSKLATLDQTQSI